jgi:hypothetical protein
VQGWLAVDHIVYTLDVLQEADLRFEQHCDVVDAALRGTIHWRADDSTLPPGPVNPPPADLWRPDASTPSENTIYVLLQRGSAAPTLLTEPTASIRVATLIHSAIAQISVLDNQNPGSPSDFVAMVGVSQLEPGYYGNLLLYPNHNPAHGGLRWSLNTGTCSVGSGWFVIDHIRYTYDIVTELDLRFEQLCDQGATVTQPLHGQIHYVRP